MSGLLTVHDRKRVAAGLRNLVEAAVASYPQNDARLAYLNGHPFGLELPPGIKRGRNCIAYVMNGVLLPGGGRTDVSDYMALIVCSHLGTEDPARLDVYFRVIKCVVGENLRKDQSEQQPLIHDLYFEYGFGGLVYIAGESNDYTGGGGYRGRAMRSMFNVAAALLGLTVHEHVVACEEYSRFRQRIQNIDSECV